MNASSNQSLIVGAVRSLHTVGGARPNRQYTRRLNRRARALGFPTWRAAVAHIKAVQVLAALGVPPTHQNTILAGVVGG